MSTTSEEFQDRLPPPGSQRHPVVIVGGGIAGLATALGLGKQGVRTLLLEADSGVCEGSRAICVSRRSLEIIARLGALGPFLEKGLPWTGGRSFYRDVEVLRFSMPHDASQRLPPMINLQQYYIEQFLLDAAEQCEQIEVRWQSEVQNIAVRPDGVTLVVGTDPGSYAIDADWVIGCDGARSRVREAMGLKLKGTSYEGRYVIVDVALKSDRRTERLAWFDPPSNPGSTILMHRQPDDVWRIDYQLRDDEDPEQAVRPENVMPRVERHLRMIGERDDWVPIWISLYRANALTLESYRQGRLIVAGDAAHLVPIFGVRGANSAFEDADNLAWKLPLVLNGAAPESLLDTYSQERVHAARENLRQGMKSTEFMSPPSFGFELMRKAVLGLAVDHPFVRPLINPRQTQAICYSDSPLNGPSMGEFAAGPPAGAVACECALTLFFEDGFRLGHLTELLTSSFTAICFSSGGHDCGWTEAITQSMRESAVPFRLLHVLRERPEVLRERLERAPSTVVWDHTGRVFASYGATPGTVYLLRPDGHVLARWRHGAAAEVRAAIGNALGLGVAGSRRVGLEEVGLEEGPARGGQFHD
jgi:3-(3-hydroxy-phenyl)propionate hydroxylase